MLFRIAAVLAVAIALTSLACEDDDNVRPGPSPSVVGTVTLAEDGAPVRGVTILLVDVQTLAPAPETGHTDDSGRYSISGVAPGEYLVLVVTDAFSVHHRDEPTVRIANSTTATFDMSLMPQALWADIDRYRIEGTVIDRVTSEPLPRAYVSGFALAWQDVGWMFLGYGLPYWTFTDEEGKFSTRAMVWRDAPGHDAGLFPLSVTREGYRPFTLVGEGRAYPWPFGPPLPLPADGDSILTVTVRMTPVAGSALAGAIEGSVKTLDGDPVPAIGVALSLVMVSDPDTLRSAGPAPVPVPGKVGMTSPDGRFFFDGLMPGKYVAQAAFRVGDGYMPSMTVRRAGEAVVAGGDTADAGVIEVMRTMSPIHPPDRGVVGTRTPVFRWEPAEAADDYRLLIAAHELLDIALDPEDEPHWQVPDSLALTDGSQVSWIVYAHQGTAGGSIVVSSFEETATFSVDVTSP